MSVKYSPAYENICVIYEDKETSEIHNEYIYCGSKTANVSEGSFRVEKDGIYYIAHYIGKSSVYTVPPKDSRVRGFKQKFEDCTEEYGDDE